MSVEGIFRKNGNIRRLKELTEAIDRDAASVELSTDNPVQLAALLKKFLRDLPEPLLTFKLHRLYIASQCTSPPIPSRLPMLITTIALPSDDDRRRLLHMVSLLLPRAHRDTMEVIFVFLKWVASFSHLDAETGSKMDLGNLATVICPSILYSRGREAVRDDSFGAIRVVTALLENQDAYYTVPEDFLGILHDQEYFANSMELPGKEFMKKCDTYMRLKASGRPVVTSPPSAPFSNNQRFQSPDVRERPQMMASTSDPQIRNGSRQQSPVSHTYNPMSQSQGPPASLSQNVAMIQGQPQQQQQQQQQSRNQTADNGNDMYPPQRPPNGNITAPRPTSYVPPLTNGEMTYSATNSNGHPPANSRQRP